MNVRRRCVVSGRVQGVFFRARTRDKAVSLGLSGYAVSLPDGRVEVLVSGPAANVDCLCEWLREGSPMARVDAVECEPLAAGSEQGFRVG